jgi:hypothetical protein
VWLVSRFFFAFEVKLLLCVPKKKKNLELSFLSSKWTLRMGYGYGLRILWVLMCVIYLRWIQLESLLDVFFPCILKTNKDLIS